MSVVIIGGNERMVCQYTDICRDFGCKAHKMVISASQEAKRNRIPIARVHTSSGAALRSVLEQYCA